MAKLMYKGTQEIKGHIMYETDVMVEIKLDAGGSMLLSKNEVKLVPDKETKKRIKKEYKKATDTDVAGESEE
jgi:hypothetical protein